MTGDEKKQRAIEFLGLCETGQVDRIAPMITDDYHFESMKRANPPGQEGKPLQNLVDRRAFLDFVPGVISRTQAGLNLTVDLAMADGDDVALFGNSNAVTLKGKTYSNTYCWFFRFTGDKISLFREYCDFHLVHTVLRA